MTVALPVRPVPAAGEPLTSYAARLADANGLTRSMVLPAHRHDVGVPAGELDTLATLAGLDPAAAAQLTMDRYPPTVRGQGPTHRGGWRLHFSADWTCPQCTLLTGRRELLWQTALSPMCRHCNVLLTPATAASTDGIVDAGRDLTVLVNELIELAEASITHHTARVRLGRFRRLCALIAQTIDDTWPHRHDALPPVDESAARGWGAFPSADPATVATILISAATALHSTAFHDQFSREGHTRRRGAPTRHPRKYLPLRPPAPPRRTIVAGFNATDSGRLRWLLTQLEHHGVRHGIRPEHVPALLPHPDDDGLPNPADWRTRWHASLALHILLTQTHEGAPSSSRAALAFGTADSDTSRLLDGVRLGRGISHTDAHLLGDAVTVLLNDGLIDYQRRRDILRPITTLPRLPVPASNLPEIDGYAPRVLALGWIWTRLTRGPMWTSPYPLVPDRHVRTFNAAIDPATRLALHEAGQQLFADADLLTIPAARATFPGVTRRYG